MIEINVIGFKQIQQAINKLPTTLRKEVGTELRLGAEQFRDLAIKDAPADVGFLRSKIVVEPKGELSYEVVSGSKYSAPMEFGTKGKFQPIPGVDSSEFKGQPTGTWLEFISNIKNWARRKGLPASAAYPIARSILNKGVTPHPFFFKQLPIVRKDLLSNLNNTLKELLG